MVNILTVFTKIWQLGLVKHFFGKKKKKEAVFFQLTIMFFVTVIDAVWNDGRWSDENQNSDQSWIRFFLNNVFCVSDAENQELSWNISCA